MSSLWDVPQYLIMAFSLALDAPAEKASRVSFPSHPVQAVAAAKPADLPGDDVWLRAVKVASPHSDVLQSYAARIFVTSTGRYYVATSVDRAEILALRHNTDIMARVLAAATTTLHDHLAERAHHEPTRGALVIAHMLGEEAAVRYLRALIQSPHASVLGVMPSLNAAMGGERQMTFVQLDARLTHAARQPESQVAAGAEGGNLKGTMTKPEGTPANKFASR